MSWWRILFWASMCKHNKENEDISCAEAFKREMKKKRFKAQLVVMLVPFIWFLISAACGKDLVLPLVLVVLGILISFIMDIVKNVKKMKDK